MNLSPAMNERGAGGAVLPVAVLALMMVLVPAVGATSVLMLQDTLKSAVVAFGVLTASLLFFWQQRRRGAPLLWHGLVALPMALMLYAMVSMMWAHAYLAGVEAIRWFVLTLLLWLGLNVMKRREQVTTLAWAIHGGTLIASIWAALQFWLDWSLFPQAVDPASTFSNRNFFAEYAVCTLPFSVYVLARLRESRWLAWVALSVSMVVVAIIMTGTRSALIALLMLVPVLMLSLFKYRHQFTFSSWKRSTRTLVSMILLAGVLGMGLVPSGNVRIVNENVGTTALQRSFARAVSMQASTEYTEGSFSMRAAMWKATGRMMMANPFWGVGAGSWEVQIPLYQHFGEALETAYFAHNEFLQLLAEYGAVVGGLFLAVLLAYLWLAAGKTWRLQDENLDEAPLRAIALASLLALMIVSNAGFTWRLASTGALLVLCLAILAASDARLGIGESFFVAPLPWRPAFSRAMSVSLFCCLVLAAHITLQAALAERKIVGALRLASYAAKSKSSAAELSAAQRTRVIENIREGIAINPHYRRLTAMVADNLAANGDWANAVWIWESVAASRPNVPTTWFNIAQAHTQLGQNDMAMASLNRARSLEPEIRGLRTLEIVLLSRTGHEMQAADMLTHDFDQGRYEIDSLQVAYVIGLKTRNWALAIRSLELRKQTWPAQAAEAFLLLGMIYADPAVGDQAKALASFREGLQAAPPEQRGDYLKRVPHRYHAGL